MKKRSASMDWLVGGGEMGKLIRSMDWSKTPLGPIESWPQSLRTTVSLCLASNFPISIAWGPHHIQIYNDGYWPVCGAKHPYSMGQDFSECWASAWPAIGEVFRRACDGETSYLENRRMFLDRNGYLEETFFTFSFSPIRDESGGVGGLFHPVTELTQQTLAERRLKVIRDLSDRTTDAKTVEEAIALVAQTVAQYDLDLPFVLIYLVDPSGKQAYLVESVGLEPATIVTPTVVDLEASSPSIWMLGQALRSRQSVLVENLEKALSAVSYGPYPEPPQRALTLPINLPGIEHPFGLLIAGVSPRRSLDRPYQLFYEMLKDAVTNALSNARAYEAERKRAEALAEIDRAKTVFFSNVSHEFRTPLTLILAPAEDALADTEAPLPPIQRDRIEIVQRNSLRLLKLVNTLLDFSRIEAGRIQSVYEPTDLATFTAELASTFRSLIERAGMKLAVECPPLPEAIYVDREMWEKIVLNLLSNAFKFTFAGAITTRLKHAGDHVELAIEDTGIGIPPDEIPHLFERFHRVKGAQGRSFEGSGIGLSLVNELVKLHGGSMTVTSTVGKGSCFTVSIPTGTAHLPQDRIGASRTLASTAMGAIPYVEEALRWLPQTEGGEWHMGSREESMAQLSCSLYSVAPASILVVDDNADMRNYVKRLLGQRYEVEVAEDGVTALNLIHQHIPDLVLTDVMMPRLDGFALLQALRADVQTRELPIILLSARAGEESRIEGLEAGADDYLIKPFSNRELLARVEACLKMAQIRREAAIREQTLRLAAEQAHRETEATAQRLDHILESMSDAFLTLDKHWHIIYQNAAAEKINHSKPRNQVLGKSHWEEWPATLGSELERQYRYALAEQVPVHFEYHYYEPPEFDMWVEIHAYPVDEGLGIFFRDISERKQAEAKLKHYSEELELRVTERTIELRQSIAELQQTEDQLKASLQEKEVLLKEMHHRVKNNLGIVSGLLQMQARRIPDPQARTILRDSQNRISSIALVHEKLYRSENLANIDFSQYIQDLTIYLFDSYNISSSQITLDIQVEKIDLDIETAIPCGLIVNELVSNALKHAFPDERTGTIQIRLRQSGSVAPGDLHHSLFTLIVRDDGVGLPHDFNPEKATTLGLSLVHGLVSQIRGTIEINCQQGTEFKVTFGEDSL